MGVSEWTVASVVGALPALQMCFRTHSISRSLPEPQPRVLTGACVCLAAHCGRNVPLLLWVAFPPKFINMGLSYSEGLKEVIRLHEVGPKGGALISLSLSSSPEHKAGPCSLCHGKTQQEGGI